MEPQPKKTVEQTFVDGFHKHLDECKRCRENPFDLCQIGSLLLGCTSTARSFDRHQQGASHPFDPFTQP